MLYAMNINYFEGKKNHIPFSYDPRTMICVLKYHNNITVIFLLLYYFTYMVRPQLVFISLFKTDCDDGSASTACFV